MVVVFHPVHADHQNNKWRFAFNVQRLVYFGENLAHLLQQAVQRFRIAQLLTAGAFRQVGMILRVVSTPTSAISSCSSSSSNRSSSIFLPRNRLITGTEILLRFQQATLEAGEAFFVGFSCS